MRPDDHRARGAQARDRRRICRRRRRIGKQLRAGARDVARDVEQVLDRHRQPVHRRAPHARLAQAVRVVGIGARRVRIDLQERARALARRIGDARERQLRQLAAAGFARGEIARKLLDRPHAASLAHNIPRAEDPGRNAFRRQLLSLQGKGRRHAVRALRRGSAAPRRGTLPALRARFARRRRVRPLPDAAAGLRRHARGARLRLSRRRAGAGAQVPRRTGARAVSGRPASQAAFTASAWTASSPCRSRAERLRSRGYNQSLEIARRVAAATGARLAPELCERRRDTAAQMDLPLDRAREERARRLPLPAASSAARRVAVLDDVMTTGATLDEIAATLKRAGAARVVNWVVARTPPAHV